MKNDSQLDFDKRILAITLTPILIVALIAVVVVTLRTYRNLSQTKDHITKIVDGQIQDQLSFISEEVYFRQTEAIENRLVQMAESLDEISKEHLQICLIVTEVNDVLLTAQPKSCRLGVDSKAQTLSIPLRIGDVKIATIGAQISILPQFWLTEILENIVIAAGICLMLSLLHIYLLNRLKSQILQPLLCEIESKSRHETIAMLVRMLAHDIKRPITLATAGFELLHRTKNMDQVNSLLPMLKNNISKANHHVESMLKDVMYLGETTQSEVSVSTNLTECLQSSIDQLNFFLKDSPAHSKNTLFRFDIQVDRQIVGASDRWTRVFVNLFENAIQAMKIEGTIWVNCTQSKPDFARIEVGNDHSYIDPEDLKKLFDQPFSRRGSTGIGTKVIYNIVKLNSGKISCESHPDFGTKFIIEVPLAKSPALRASWTYQYSQEVIEFKSGSELEITPPRFLHKKCERPLKDLELFEKLRRRFNVMFVDDEPIYKELALQTIDSSGIDRDYIQFFSSTGYKDAIDFIKHGQVEIDLLIVDINLCENKSGFDIIREYKEKFPNVSICVHSNDIGPHAQSEVVKSGAHWLIPKPISEAQMLKIMVESSSTALQNVDIDLNEDKPKAVYILNHDMISSEILKIDIEAAGYQTQVYSNISELSSIKDSIQASNAILIVSDRFRDSTDLAEVLKQLRFRSVVTLSGAIPENPMKFII